MSYSEKDGFTYDIFDIKDPTDYESSTSKKYCSGKTRPNTVTIYEKSNLSKQDEIPDESTDLRTFKLDGLGIRIDKDSEPILDENGKSFKVNSTEWEVCNFYAAPVISGTTHK